MPTVTRTDTDVLTAIFNVTITKDDYAKEVNKTLNDFRKKANLKGFRKGQVPMSYVKKIHGKQVLAEALNELSYQALIDFITEHEIETIGQPLPSKDQVAPELDMRDYQDYEFKYEIGLKPEIDLKGLDKTTVLDAFEIEVGDKDVQEETDRFLSEQGEQKEVEIVTSKKDLVSVILTELEDGKPKDGGIEKEAMVALEDMENEALVDSIIGMKIGDTFETDIHELVSEAQQKDIHKYFLFVDEDVEFNDTFSVKIHKVTSVVPAEMSAEVLVAAFGREIAEKYVADFLPTEEDAENTNADDAEATPKNISDAEREAAAKGMSEEIKRLTQEQFDNTNRQRLTINFLDAMLEKNEVPLPDAFFKRWIAINNPGQNISDKDYEDTAKSLRMNFLRNAIAEKLGVFVSQKEIEDEMRDNYFIRSGMDPESPGAEDNFIRFYQQMTEYMPDFVGRQQGMKNDKNIGEKLEATITVNKQKVSTDEFNEALKKEQEAFKAKQKAEEEAAKAAEEKEAVES